jgi:hypothetical protein
MHARLHSNEPSGRGCGGMLAITRGSRHAAHHPRLAPCGSHQTPAAWRGCIPMNLQEGDVAVYWPPPAACAMRLTTRGLRHAPHGKGDFYLSHKRMR